MDWTAANFLNSHSGYSITWWIPLPEPIDLPDGHRRAITSALHPTFAFPDGKLPPDDVTAPIDVSHQIRFTIHQRSLSEPAPDAFEKELWSVSAGQPGYVESNELTESESFRTHYLSVVEAEVVLPLDAELDNDDVSGLFDEVLGRIRQLQEATALLTKTLTKDWVARERLPFALPMRTEVPSSKMADDDEGGMQLFLAGFNGLPSTLPPEPLSASNLDNLTMYLERDDEGGAFSAYHRLRYETNVMFRRRGDYRMAVISSAIAAEALINEMLQSLLWDEGRSPEDVASIFNPDNFTVRRRVAQHFSGHLGGNWDLKRKGPLRDWREKIAEPRNRIAHSGGMATFEQAQEALSALHGLEKHFDARLLASVTKRPRTALTFVGMERIKAKGKDTKRLRHLAESNDEPVWIPTFQRWRRVVELEIEKARGASLRPDPNASVLVAVVTNGDPEFFLHDEALCSAAPVLEIPASLWDQYRRGIKNRFGEQAPPDDTFFRLLLDDADMKNKLTLKSEWEYAYRVIPNAGVMADGRDRA